MVLGTIWWNSVQFDGLSLQFDGFSEQFDGFSVQFEIGIQRQGFPGVIWWFLGAEKGRVSRYNLTISRYNLMKRARSPGTIRWFFGTVWWKVKGLPVQLISRYRLMKREGSPGLPVQFDDCSVNLMKREGSLSTIWWFPSTVWWKGNGLPVQFDDFPVPFGEKGKVSRYNLMISRYRLMKREGSPGTIDFPVPFDEKGRVSRSPRYNLMISRYRLVKREKSPGTIWWFPGTVWWKGKGLPVQFDNFAVPFDEKGRVSRYNLIISRYRLMKREGCPGTIWWFPGTIWWKVKGLSVQFDDFPVPFDEKGRVSQ